MNDGLTEPRPQGSACSQALRSRENLSLTVAARFHLTHRMRGVALLAARDQLLDYTHVSGLRALLALRRFELDLGTVHHFRTAVVINGRGVDENIFATIVRNDKPESLRRIKPLYGAQHNYALCYWGPAF